MVLPLEQLLLWLVSYRYAVLFPAVVVEGPIVTIIAGFLASQGHFNLVPVYALIVVGDVVGDTFYYALGRWGRQQVVDRWGKYVGITTERVATLEHHFQHHSGKTLIIGKLSHAVGVAILVAAGAAKMSYGRFVWFNFVGSLPKSLGLLLIGFFFGQAYVQLSRFLDYAALATGILGLLGILVYVVVTKRVSKKVPGDGFPL